MLVWLIPPVHTHSGGSSPFSEVSTHEVTEVGESTEAEQSLVFFLYHWSVTYLFQSRRRMYVAGGGGNAAVNLLIATRHEPAHPFIDSTLLLLTPTAASHTITAGERHQRAVSAAHILPAHPLASHHRPPSPFGSGAVHDVDRRHPRPDHDMSAPRARGRSLPCHSNIPHSCPLLHALQPIVPHFHPFLADADAARLLRSSRSAALCLLQGYAFTSHLFEPADLASLLRLRDLAVTYGLRIRQLAVPGDLKELSFDPTPPHLSPIPASVLALSFGSVAKEKDQLTKSEQWWAAFSCAADDWQHRERWRVWPPQPASEADAPGSITRRWRLWLTDFDFHVLYQQQLPSFADPVRSVGCPLPPGLLPEGLKLLRLSRGFNQLELGSLPSTLSFLQLGPGCSAPLVPAVLPASLLCLSTSMDSRLCAQLIDGSLPASLQRLRLWGWSRTLVDVWPPQLKALHLERLQEALQPGDLPASLQYLSFGYYLPFELLPNILPSSLEELRLSYQYLHPLAPGVLPPSLRALTLGQALYRPLEVGSLPEGLLYLRFLPLSRSRARLPPLQPGVLPSTLLGLDLSNRLADEQQLAGVIPQSVRWLRLSTRLRREDVEAELACHAEVVWYEE